MSVALQPRADESIMGALGTLVSLGQPTPSMIVPREMIAHLAKLNRFCGATDGFYSVAQHTCLVIDGVSEEAKPYAALHDGHEAYIGDLTTPLKRVIRRLSEPHDPVGTLTTAFDVAIHARFGLAWPPAASIAAEVARADARAYATEVRDQMASAKPGKRLAEPFPRPIRPLPWNRAEEALLKQLGRLFPTVAF